ncbi:MAG TPA: hypothetical protein GX405_08270 [Rhizobiales bacterium]|nr:hypothetical protein [Hyphomicrobiales bacterium]
MQIAGIRSVPDGRTTRSDAPGARAAELLQPTRDAVAPGRIAAQAPLPASPVRGAAPARPVVIAFPTAENAGAAEAQTTREAHRAYRDTQNMAAPRIAVAPLEDTAQATAPARAAPRPARTEAPTRDEAAADAPRQMPGSFTGVLAQGLAALWRFLPGRTDAVGDRQRTARGNAAAAARRAGEVPADQGGWTEALTLFTLVATVCLAIWLLLF